MHRVALIADFSVSARSAGKAEPLAVRASSVIVS
jgi:hypothetical protein